MVYDDEGQAWEARRRAAARRVAARRTGDEGMRRDGPKPCLPGRSGGGGRWRRTKDKGEEGAEGGSERRRAKRMGGYSATRVPTWNERGSGDGRPWQTRRRRRRGKGRDEEQRRPTLRKAWPPRCRRSLLFALGPAGVGLALRMNALICCRLHGRRRCYLARWPRAAAGKSSRLRPELSAAGGEGTREATIPGLRACAARGE